MDIIPKIVNFVQKIDFFCREIKLFLWIGRFSKFAENSVGKDGFKVEFNSAQ